MNTALVLANPSELRGRGLNLQLAGAAVGIGVLETISTYFTAIIETGVLLGNF